MDVRQRFGLRLENMHRAWATAARRMFSLQPYLVLGRVARLPTVWSNCLAGWWLGGGGNVRLLPGLFAGVSFIFIGGGFLNDALDASDDLEHQRARPIPSGAVSRRAALLWGWAWMALGLASLFWMDRVSGILGVVLACGVVAHNGLHRIITFSPVILGLCRFFVYMIGASTAFFGVSGWAIWCGLAVAAYVAGMGWLARVRTLPARFPYWPVLLLAVPILLALLMDTGVYRTAGVLLSLILALWLVRCLWRLLSRAEGDLTGMPSGLVAGIVFVDWLASAGSPRFLSFIFIGLFLLTLGLHALAPTE